MKKPDNIEVRHLFPELYSELITILQNLSPSEWNFPTSSIKWSVKDIVAHLIDTDLRRISIQRDNLTPPTIGRQIEDYSQLVEYLDHLNNTWIETTKRFSPGVLIDLLEYVRVEIPKLFNSIEMNSEALFSVSWAGEEKSETWFDIAREYTEKWYHQQQIREAVGKPLLISKKWIYPLLDTFIRGLPYTYQKVFPLHPYATILINIEDLAEGKWILRKNNSWKLFVGDSPDYSSKIVLNSDTAWRMFSRNISREKAQQKIYIEGDSELGRVILELVTFMK